MILSHRRHENLVRVDTARNDSSSLDSESPTAAPLQPSNSTLIITPSFILPQWISELSTLSPSLSFYTYFGLEQEAAVYVDGDSDSVFDQIVLKLSGFDVLFTTYSVLRKEFHVAKVDSTRSRRSPRQYRRKRSPLAQIEFWRICLDEAQMVENLISNTASMARLIPRINAWAISGTPCRSNQTALADLFGLCHFLGVLPWAHSLSSFATLLDVPERFITLFQSIMRRNSKKHVEEETRIPPQHEQWLWLDFSEIEAHNYHQLANQLHSALNHENTHESQNSFLLQLRQTW